MAVLSRSRPLTTCLVLATALAGLRQFAVEEQTALVSSKAVRIPFAGHTAPVAAAGGGRGGVPVNFFDKIAESLGFGKDPEAAALKDLQDMAKVSIKQAAKEQSSLKEQRAATRTAMSVLQGAMSELREAEEEALQGCQINWDSDEASWDEDLKTYADPVLEKAAAAQKALITLETSNVELLAACDAVEASGANRTAAAKKLVAKLDAEAQERLAHEVEQAAQPISDGEALRQWVLAKAEVVDAKREFTSSQEVANMSPEELTGNLRERRAARCKAEVAAAAAKAAEEEAAKAAAEKAKAAAEAPAPTTTSASEAEEDGPGGAIFGAIALIAVGAAVFFGSGGDIAKKLPTSVGAPKTEVVAPAATEEEEEEEVEAPAPPAVKMPEVKLPEVKIPEVKIPVPTPAPAVPEVRRELTPMEEKTKNSEEDLTGASKVQKGELLGLLK